ncbi:glycosyltransferase family 4 protein [Litoribacter alkaliphilus]|uniref:Glycosyltransferase family 4 protein n=1 Tax=Litoribacter ruber TaxID=702568 RepID=A0AAP2CKG5_9BACT|nr:glycosyltransferase family 4 protein [Litoribacter alkaliphilus]MBS9523452.1 glycosyltransferase family 4 protein [Litoribacter alkaliphilus]
MVKKTTEGKTVLFLHGSADLYGSSLILLFVIESAMKIGVDPVVVLPYRGQLSVELEKRGVKVKIQNLGVLRRKYFNPLGLANRILKLFAAYRFLNKLHRENRFSLIYTNTLAVLVGAFFARNKGIAHVWHVHEIIPSPSFLVKFLAGQMKSSDHVLAVSKAVSDHWKSLGVQGNVKVIHNGIPIRDTHKPEWDLKAGLGIKASQIVVTMVGRVNPGKGQFFYLDMAKEILKTRQDVVFLMAGDPYPGYEFILDEMKEFIRKHEMEENVIDLGFRSDIDDILAISDIFVLPSIMPDSFPTVILEAMGAGLPVVATRSGGAAEMIEDGINGYLIPVSDAKAGTKCLFGLIEDKELRKEMGRKSQNRAKALFGLERFDQEIKSYLGQVLQQRKPES